MAQRRRGETKDLLARMTDAGEEAIQRLSEVPGGKRMLDAVSGVRDRVDELQHRVRNLAELEKRVKALEKKVDELSKPKPRRRATTARKTTTRRSTATKKS